MRIVCASSDETLKNALFGMIRKDLEAIPGGFQRVILAVPRQSTFSVEEEAMETLGGKGFMTLNIISSEKLRKDIIRETGGSGRVYVDSTGRSMMLRKALKQAAPQLDAFASVSKDPRFTAVLKDFIVQMKQGGLGPQDLKELAGGVKAGSLLSRKLSDMSLISQAYEQLLSGTYSDSEDELAFAASRVKDSDHIRTSKIYYYGFSSLSVLEAELLKELDRCSAGLCVALVSGQGMQYEATRRCIELLGVQAEYIGAEAQRGQGSADAAKAPDMELVSCASPFTQAETLAARIMQLVREEGADYSDMVVLTPEQGSDGQIIKRVLTQAGIPVFMDERRAILHSSSAQTVSSLMALADGKYLARDVVSFLRSGAVNAPEDDIWTFCHYVKQFHIKGKAFLKPFKYKNKDFTDAQFAACESIRAGLASLLESFTEEMAGAETAAGKAEVLRSFLAERIGLPERLEAQAVDMAAEGFADAAEETRQLWGIIDGILAQMTELIGSEKISNEEMADILMDALSDVKVGLLPQAEGKVQIGGIRRSLPTKKKAVFITSMCDGLIPSGSDGSALLTEAELKQLSDRGKALARTRSSLISEEVFMAARAAQCAKDLLWIGVPAGSESGETLSPSPLLPMIKKMCGSVTELKDIENSGDDLAFMQGSRFPLGRTAQILRAGTQGDPVPELWKAAYNILSGDAPQLKAALKYKPGDKPLGKELAADLYGKDGKLSLSPSRLDNFAACPFKHYIEYGLRPLIPRDFGIGAREVGDILHEALLKLCEALSAPARKAGKPITDPSSLWMTVSREQAEAMLAKILDDMAEEAAGGALTSSKAEAYRGSRLRIICMRFAWHLVEQVRAGSIDEMFFETGFGRGATFPPIVLHTAAGDVFVEGKIDRVDRLPAPDGGSYTKIVDYKSGSTSYNQTLIEKGLALQLMTYLEGAIGDGASKPAGIYYFRISSDDISAAVEDISSEALSEKLTEAINKKYKLDGLTVQDEHVLCGIDKELLQTGKSTVLDVSRDSKGELKGKLISPEDMEAFRKNFRSMLTSAAESIAMGRIDADPKKVGNIFDSCKYCAYSGICLKDTYR